MLNKSAVISALANNALLRFDGTWTLTDPAIEVPSTIVEDLLLTKAIEIFENSRHGTFYRLRKPMDHSIFSLAATFSGNPDLRIMREQRPFTPPTSGLSWTAREILFGLYLSGASPIAASEMNHIKRFWQAGWITLYTSGEHFMWALTSEMCTFIMADLQKEPSKPSAATEELIKLEELDL